MAAAGPYYGHKRGGIVSLGSRVVWEDGRGSCQVVRAEQKEAGHPGMVQGEFTPGRMKEVKRTDSQVRVGFVCADFSRP
jgi:hypothetical protein